MPEGEEVKVGARNNSNDMQRLQAIHDMSVASGAECKPMDGKSIDVEETMVSFGSEIKSLGDGKFGGYLVRFTTQNDPDLTGDFFDVKTDFDIDFPSQSTVYFNHGLDPQLKKRKLGKADIKVDEVGVWAEFIMQERDEYEKALSDMAKAGKMGWSSGTAAHLVERESVGKAMHIKKWPLGLDASITHTPAEPRNMVVSLKSLSVLTPEADAESSAQKGENKDTLSNPGESKMELDEKQLQEFADKAADNAVKAYVAAQPSEREADVQVIEDEADRALKAGFKTEGEFFMAVKSAAMFPGNIDKRLLPLKAAAGLNETIPSQAGFLVQSTIATGIWERMYNTGTLLSKFAMDQVGPNSNGMTYNAIDETSRADGSRFGGVQGYWLNEAGTKTASKPTFRQVELKLKKVAALCYATDELLEDATALSSWIQRTVPEELRFKVEDAIVNGDGVGKPLGYAASPAAIALNPTTINTAVAADVLGMWARRWVGANDYIWLCDQSVIPQLATMSVGNMPVWLPPSGLLGPVQQGTLLGRPLYEVEYCAALSSTDYFLHLVSPSQYALIGKGGIQAAESIHVQFLTDQSVFRFVYRVDGSPMWNTTLTTKSGTTVSPFILLGSTTP
jgi:HK97 family phage major capsid protein